MLFRQFEEEKNFDLIQWVNADLLDLPSLDDAFEGIKQVYHAAAVVSFKKSDSSSMIAANVEGTANMVNLAIKHGVDKFCFVSSVAALGKYRDGSCADEETLWQKEEHTSDYSISKFYSENEVWRAAQEGLNTVIVNPSTIIGFGDWNQSSNTLFKKIHQGLSFYPSGSTGFVSVEDVVACMIRLMESDINGRRFVLSSENRSFESIFNKMAGALGKTAPKIGVKKWQATLYVRIMSLLRIFYRQENPITIANVHSAFNKRCFDSSRIEKELQFEFEPIDSAIERSASFYLKAY